MESRKITVVQTKNQKKSVVMTNATTLGELKDALNEAGIDYEGMTFYEGLSKTELKQDSSILPHDIERNGTVTNELVFMLTNTDKKIRSGASMSRPQLYDYIKKNGLQDEVKKKYGKNFTMCKTDDLQSIVNTYMKKNENTNHVETTPVTKEEPKAEVKVETTVDVAPHNKGNIYKAIEKIVEILYQNDIIEYTEDKDEILNILYGNSESNSIVKDNMSSPYSDAEIARMMRDMK